jgi:hypothetical protein
MAMKGWRRIGSPSKLYPRIPCVAPADLKALESALRLAWPICQPISDTKSPIRLSIS